MGVFGFWAQFAKDIDTQTDRQDMAQKILLVEDEQDLREILSFIIENEVECQIITASSGNEGIKKLSENPDVSIILSDYSMPNGTGGDLFQYNIKNRNLPFILITGGYFDDYEDMAGFFNVNKLNQIVQKPVDEQGLIGAVKSAIAESK